MTILFIGTVEFSRQALGKLISLDTDIVGVCTKETSSFNSDFADLTSLCQQNDIAFKFIKDINSQDSIQWIKSLSPDIIYCFGWSSLIKRELLELAPMGVVGYHPAQLPYNRGRHPLIWALALGLEQSASTFFFMKEGADDGDILSQKVFSIEYEDNASSLYKKVITIALEQIEIFTKELSENRFAKISQNHELANTWRKRGFSDGLIDFRMSSFAIYNLVRALSKPYVGASIRYNNENITIWKVEEVDINLPHIEYGKILEVSNNTILVKCYDKAVRILKHEFSNLPQKGEYI